MSRGGRAGMNACRAMHAAWLEGCGDVHYFSTKDIFRRDDLPLCFAHLIAALSMFACDVRWTCATI